MNVYLSLSTFKYLDVNENKTVFMFIIDSEGLERVEVFY